MSESFVAAKASHGEWLHQCRRAEIDKRCKVAAPKGSLASRVGMDPMRLLPGPQKQCLRRRVGRHLDAQKLRNRWRRALNRKANAQRPLRVIGFEIRCVLDEP